jgi:hypothetical protein
MHDQIVFSQPGAASAEVAVARWHYLKETNAKKASDPLNIVLIPYPFSVSAKCFQSYSDAGMPGGAKEWGWFDVRQRWLTERGDPRDIRDERVQQQAWASLTRFVSAIVNHAKEDVGDIHGVVFPELALDWNTLQQIYTSLRRSGESGPEFVISGVSTNARSEEGNFVAMLMKDGTTIVRPKPTGGNSMPIKSVDTLSPAHWIRNATGGSISIFRTAASTCWFFAKPRPFLP